MVAAIGAAVAVVAVAALTAAPARADGGARPSAAPLVVSGQTVTGGADSPGISCGDGWQCAGEPGVQYWRISLGLGDRLTVDFQNVAGSGTQVCILSGTVSDYTVAGSECLAEADTPESDYGQLTYTAARTATYYIVPSAYGTASWGYSLTPHVAHRSAPKISLTGPRRPRVGHPLSLHGSIAPAISTTLTLRSKSPAHGWEVAGHATPDGDGRFSFTYRPAHRGLHEFQVVFNGNGFYLPASTTWRVRVRK